MEGYAEPLHWYQTTSRYGSRPVSINACREEIQLRSRRCRAGLPTGVLLREEAFKHCNTLRFQAEDRPYSEWWP